MIPHGESLGSRAESRGPEGAFSRLSAQVEHRVRVTLATAFSPIFQSPQESSPTSLRRLIFPQGALFSTPSPGITDQFIFRSGLLNIGKRRQFKEKEMERKLHFP